MIGRCAVSDGVAGVRVGVAGVRVGVGGITDRETSQAGASVGAASSEQCREA